MTAAHTRRRAARFVIAAGFLAVLLGLPPTAAQAQTSQVLVSNTGKPQGSGRTLTGSAWWAQPFQTGSHDGGYNLASVVLRLDRATSNPIMSVTVSIRADSSGDPSDTDLVVLGHPTDISDGLNTFTAPLGATLEADTRYHVVLRQEGTQAVQLKWFRATLSDGVDDGAAEGWDIPVVYRRYASGSWDTNTATRTLQLQVIGSPVSGEAPTLPVVTVAAEADSVIGGSANPAVFTLTRTEDPATPLTVNISATNNKAAPGWTGPVEATFEVTMATTEVRIDTSPVAPGDADGVITLTIESGDFYTVGEAPGNTAMVTFTPRVDRPATGTPTITGIARLGETLTVSTTGITDPDGAISTFSYQWERETTAGMWEHAGSEVTTNTYLVVDADLGRRLRVEVSTEDGGGGSTSGLLSEPTVAVLARPVVTVRAETARVIGGFGNNAVFVISRATATAFPLVVHFTVGGDQRAFLNIGALPTTATILADRASVNVPVPTSAQFSGDMADITLTLDANSAYTLGTDTVAMVTVIESQTVGVRAQSPSVVGDGTSEVVFVFDVTGGATVGIDFDITGTGAFSGSSSSQTDTSDGGTIRRTTNALTPGTPSIPVTFTINSVEDPPGYTIAPGMGSATVTVTAPTGGTTPANAEPMGMPTIDGMLRVGQQLTAVTTGISDPDGPATLTFSGYQWRRADDAAGTGEMDIGSATSSTYTLGMDDAGKFIQVVASYTDAGSTMESVASAWAEVLNSAPVGTPSVGGMLTVGQDAMAVTTGISDPDGPPTLSFSYQWRRADDATGTGEANIGGETGSSYTIAAGDAGKYLQVVVTYTDGGDTEETLSSTWTAVGNSAPTGGPPTIDGTFRVGQDLAAVTTGISDPDGPAVLAFSYQWRRADDGSGGGAANIGTNSNTYRLVAADAGKFIRVVVSFTDGGGTEERLESAWTQVENSAPTGGPPTITGTARVGQDLAAVTTGISDPDGPAVLAFSYQWRRADDGSGGGAANIGTNSNTYRLVAADAGKFIRVVVTYTDGGDTEERLESVWTEVENSAPVGTPSVGGMLTVGQDAMAVTTGISDPDGPAVLAFSYQWRRADDGSGGGEANIGGETGSSYTIAVGDAGKYLQVVVTYTDGGDTEETLSSTWTAVGNSAPTGGPPTIDGTFRVGQDLTVVTTGIADADGPAVLAFSYQWRRADDAAGTVNAMDIGSETTSNTYTLAEADAGKFIRVIVTYTDGGGREERLESAWTQVENSAPTGGPPTIDGTARVGLDLTAVTSGISDPDGPAVLAFSYQWRRADDGSGGGAANIGTNSNTYRLVAADAGKFIRVVVSFTDGGDTEESLESAWTQVENSAPTGGPPTIDGTFRVGQDLTAVTTGIADADGPAVLAFSYQWRRADDGSGGGAANIGTNSNTYRLVTADAGKFIRVVVTYTDGGGTEESLESAWTQVENSAPTGGPPTIDGTFRVEQELTAVTTGIADADGPSVLSFRYQWRRADDAAGTVSAMDIGSETTSNTYTLAEADAGKFIQVVVSFTDGGGRDERLESAWTEVENSAPTGGPPTIDGTLRVDEELTAITTGIMDPDGTTAFTYQWRRADDAVGTVNAMNIGSETTMNTYTLAEADAGKFIQVVVTYTDGGGRDERLESAWAEVLNTPATGMPTIDGTARVGQDLTAITTGIMDPDGTGAFSYQWRRANDGSGGGAADIGTDSDTYPLVAADAGKFIRVIVTYTDGGGADERAESDWTEVLNTPATGMPTIDGTLRVDEELTAITTGIMDPDGTTAFTYQWRRADDAAGTVNAMDIGSATGTNTYTLAEADAGKYLQVVVTYTDGGGTDERAESDWTQVLNSPPTGLPTISGTLTVGQTATAMTDGISDPDGPATLTFTYQWRRADDAAGTADADIGSATSSTYEIASGDVDKYLQVVVSYTDSGGEAESVASAWVAVGNSVPTGMPTIDGTFRVTQELTAVTTGISDADGPTVLSFTYQWRRADDATGGGEADIGSATSSTYTLTTADAGKFIQVVASFTDSGSTVENVPSAWTQVENSAPAGGPPTIAGMFRVAQELTAVTTGITDADGPSALGFRYQWRRADDAAGTVNVMNIGSETTTNTYTLAEADARKFIQVVVSYTDGGETVERLESAWTQVENSAPTGGPPTISGTLRVTQELTAVTTGIADADGPAALSFRYQWRRADDAAGANNAMDIGSATGTNTYTLAEADARKFIQVVVTYTDSGETMERLESAWTQVENTPATGMPGISGTLRVGEDVTATTTGIMDPDGTGVFAYQWRRADDAAGANNAMDIGSETASNAYRLTTDDAGKYLQVVVTFTDGGETEESVESDWTEVLNSPPTGMPTISGNLAVGQTATAVTTTIMDPDGPATLSFTYQWRRADDDTGGGEADIGSATSSTYDVASGDVDKYLQVVVMYTDGGGEAESLASAWAAVGNSVPEGMPSIDGTLRVGEDVTAMTGGISDADGPAVLTFTYQWRRADDAAGTGDADIGSATSSTYMLTTDDAGKYLQVVASFTDSGSTVENVPSAWTEVLNSDPVGLPTISGTLTVGEAVTAVTDDISDADGPAVLTFSGYQWWRADDAAGTAGAAEISGENAATYTLDTADEGKHLRVVVTYSDGGNTMENVQSAWTATAVMAVPEPMLPEITVAAPATSVVGGEDAVFRLSRTGDPTAALTVSIAITGTHSVSSSPTSATFAAGMATALVPVTTTEVTGADQDVILTVQPGDGSTYTVGTSGAATVTVTAPDSQPTLPEITVAAPAASVVGGEDAVFTLTRTGDPTAALTVSIAITGTHSVSSSPTSAVFAAGMATALVSIPTTEVTGAAQTVILTIEPGDGSTYTVGTTGAATVTVTAPPLPEITVAVQTGGESVVGGSANPAVFTLTRTEPTADALTVGIAVTGTHAVTSPPTSAIFPATMTTALVSIPTTEVTGAAQTVTLTIEPGDGSTYTVGTPDAATVTVTDRPVNSAATGRPAITTTGRLAVGWELVAGAGDMADENGLPQSEDGYSYLWRRADDAAGTINVVVIESATSASYTLDAADEGKHLQVLVSFTDGDGYPERRPSAWTSAVEAFDPAAQAEALLETTEQSLALLAPSLAASTVQVLTTRFENLGGAGGIRSAATLGGRPLGASASAAEITREVAGLFGLNLPAAGTAGRTAAQLAGSGSAAAPPTGTASAGMAAPGAFEAQGGAARSLDVRSTAAHFDRGPGRGAGDTGNTGDWRGLDTGNLHSPELRSLLAKSSFSVGLGAAHGAHGGAQGGAHWTLWGRGAVGGFEGRHEDSALDIEGENVSAYMGADVQRGGLALGLAVGWSEGELDYTGAAERSSGELETELTSVHPYLHWSGGENLSIYAMLGYGTGEATLAGAMLDGERLTAALTSDLEMRMLAAGMRSTLSGTATGRRYDLKLDAFWSDLESDGASATEQDRVQWHASDTQSRRVRLALVGMFPLTQGLMAEGELAARVDGGDAQTGNGLELGAGLRWAQGGFSLAAEGRVLLVQSAGDFDDYEEWGASLEASYTAGGMGRGLRFTLSPAWGDVQSGVDALYESSGALHELGDDARRSERRSGGLPDRLDFELGYGLAALGGRAELLPFTRFSAGSASETRVRLGTRLDLSPRAGDALPVQRLGVELFGEEQAGENRDQRVGLEMKLGF